MSRHSKRRGRPTRRVLVVFAMLALAAGFAWSRWRLHVSPRWAANQQWLARVQAPISLAVHGVPLERVLTDLRKRTGLQIHADPDALTHPMTIIVAMFFWGTAFGGILGMIMAIPLTAFGVVFWRLVKEKYVEEWV